MDYIDKQELAEECLTIIKKLHERGSPIETKRPKPGTPQLLPNLRKIYGKRLRRAR